MRTRTASRADRLIGGGRTSAFTALRRAVSWHRRTLAAIAAAVAMLAVVSALSPPPAPSVRVVVTAAALPAGTQLSPADLALLAVPPDLVPEQAVTDIAVLDGRVLAAARTAGEILTSAAVVAPRRSSDGTGPVTTPVRLADPDVVALLAVGDVVDVVAADPRTGSSAVVAENARIVAIPRRPPAGGPLGAPAGQSGELVLVEVEPDTATDLATAAANGRLSVVWRS